MMLFKRKLVKEIVGPTEGDVTTDDVDLKGSGDSMSDLICR